MSRVLSTAPPPPLPNCHSILNGQINPCLRTSAFVGVQQWQDLYYRIVSLRERHEAVFANDTTLPRSAEQCLNLSVVLVAAIHQAVNPVPDEICNKFGIGQYWDFPTMIALSETVLVSLCQYTSCGHAKEYLGLNVGQSDQSMTVFSSRYDAVIRALSGWWSTNRKSLLPFELRASAERKLSFHLHQAAMANAATTSMARLGMTTSGASATTYRPMLSQARPLNTNRTAHATSQAKDADDLWKAHPKRTNTGFDAKEPPQKKAKPDQQSQSSQAKLELASNQGTGLPQPKNTATSVHQIDVPNTSADTIVNTFDVNRSYNGQANQPEANMDGTKSRFDRQQQFDRVREEKVGNPDHARPRTLLPGATDVDFLNSSPPTTPTPKPQNRVPAVIGTGMSAQGAVTDPARNDNKTKD